MAYSAKNEVAFRIGDEYHVLRPSFAALDAIEQRTRKTITQLTLVAEGGMSIQDIIAVLNEGSKAAGKELDEERIKILIEEYGIKLVTRSLVDFLARALFGGPAVENLTKKNQSELTPEQTSS